MPGPESIPKVFICYAREDNDRTDALRGGPWLDRLRGQLGQYEKAGEFAVFSDLNIETGEAWDAEILRRLNEATVVVVLVSDALLNSSYVHEREMPVILARAAAGQLQVVPVVLNHCDPEGVPFFFVDPSGTRQSKRLSEFQTLGTPESPLIGLPPPGQNQLLFRVAQTVRNRAREMAKRNAASSAPPAQSPLAREEPKDRDRSDPAAVSPSNGEANKTEPKARDNGAGAAARPQVGASDSSAREIGGSNARNWLVVGVIGVVCVVAMVIVFSVINRKSNESPEFTESPGTQRVVAGGVLNLQLTAKDRDQPANVLRFSKVRGPTGLTVGEDGRVTWKTAADAEASTNSVVVKVSDDGKPPGSTTTEFQVVVEMAAPKERVNSLGMQFVPVKGISAWFCIWETRYRDYEAYARENAAVDSSWRNPKFQGVDVTPGPEHPVVNVSWEDAVGFCRWLTQRERASGHLKPGEGYRLPTDLEWSAAVGLPGETGATPKERDVGVKEVYPWGRQWPPPNYAGNFADQSREAKFGPTLFLYIHGYEDGQAVTSPVGAYPNPGNGLYDLGGNVEEWCEDFYDGKSGNRVVRGGSWLSFGSSLLSSKRSAMHPDSRYLTQGFRVVLVGDGTAR